VLVLHELVASGIVAFETGPGNFGTTAEWAFQLLQLAVIRRGLSPFLGYHGMIFIGLGIFGYAQFKLRLVLGQDGACSEEKKNRNDGGYGEPCKPACSMPTGQRVLFSHF